MLPEPDDTFRDPVHGYIPVYKWEKDIIDTAAFQRLRGIRQLGLTSHIYHGAEHSRFGHSLGVMHLAGLFVRRLFPRHRGLVMAQQGWGEGEFNEKVDQVVLEARLAGLLHDIGHSPFSHTGEHRLFPEGKQHENYSEELILSKKIGIAAVIDDQLRDFGVTIKRVASIISDTGIYEVGVVRELLSSVWDVDKMDYLLRDSYYCGVQYGRFDLPRVLDTITLYDEDPDGALRLGIGYGGIHAIEGFVLARYFMFTQVYFHKIRRAYDFLLTDFIAELLQEETGKGNYPSSLDDYLQWTDWKILHRALERSKRKDKNLAWRLVTRQHPKPVYETGDHADPATVNRAIIRLGKRVNEEFPEIATWSDQASDHPERFRLGNNPLNIRNRKGWDSLRSLSKPLSGLDEIKQFRLYANVRGDAGSESKIERFCRDVMAA